MKRPPLDGVRVVVTRPREQAATLVEALEESGAEAVPIPVIEIVDPPDGGHALRIGLSDLERGDWVVITSPNGATRVAAALAGGSLRTGVSLATIGPGTERRAVALGLRVDLVPHSSIAEGLLEVLPAPGAGGGTMLLARAESARAVLPDGLRARGWAVRDIAAYRTVAVAVDDENVTRCRHSDLVAFTSASTVRHLVAGVGVDNLPPLVACIGTATAAQAGDLGLRVDISATEHNISGLVRAIADAVPGLVLLHPEPADAVDSRWMLAQYHAEIDSRSGAEAHGGSADSDAVISPSGVFIAARLAGAPVGCGGLTIIEPGVADIERMWISDRVRGRGVGRRLLRRLVVEGKALGLNRLQLETNRALTEAIALYRSEGFVEVPPLDDGSGADQRFSLEIDERPPR